MHVGGIRGKSKSEAIHIPATVNDRLKNKGTIVQLDENIYLHFTEMIKYLGSIITWDQRNEINVAINIAMGHSKITRMKELFNCRDVSIGIKIRMLQLIPLNSAQYRDMGLWIMGTEIKREMQARGIPSLYLTHGRSKESLFID
jgi:hypothetical protein